MFRWLAYLRHGRGHVELIDDLNQLLEESWGDMLAAYRRGRQESRYAFPRPTSEVEQKVYIARHKKPLRVSHSEDPFRLFNKRRSTMSQWLTKQFRPYPVGTFGGGLMEELVPGHRARMARLDERREEEDRQRHEEEIRRLKKERLEQELEDAEWILRYEERLISLQKKPQRNDHRQNKLDPTPTACGSWSTTSRSFAAPSISALALSF